MKDALDAAWDDISSAIEWNPDYGPCYISRAFLHRQRDELQSAIADCTTAIKLDMFDIYAHRFRGFCYAESGEHNRALSDFTKALDLRPETLDEVAELLILRGTSLRHLEEYNWAIEDFSLATAFDLV